MCWRSRAPSQGIALEERFPANAKIELVSPQGERFAIGKDSIPHQLEKHAAKRRRVEMASRREAARREKEEEVVAKRRSKVEATVLAR